MTVNHDVAGSSPAGGAKKEDIPYGVSSFFFHYLDSNSQHYVNIRVLYRLSVARSVAWSPSAAGGGYSEDDKAPWSILSENLFRTIKIGYRKTKHVNHDVAGITPSWRSQKKDRFLLKSVFFQRNKSFRICEIPFGREILLRNMKYACGVWIYFISQKALAVYFTISTEIISHQRS